MTMVWHQSLLAVFVTLVTYATVIVIHRRYCPYPWAHPLIISVLLLSVWLWGADLPIELYREAVKPIEWLLGPVTVALAIPIFQQRHELLKLGKELLIIIGFGGVFAPFLAWLSLYLLASPKNMQMTMLVKSITTPLAISAANEIGGISSLAVIIVIVTGILGAIFAEVIFRFAGVVDKNAKGLTYGTVAHAIGTAKAMSDCQKTGAIASVALCFNGIATALLLPLVIWLMSS